MEKVKNINPFRRKNRSKKPSDMPKADIDKMITNVTEKISNSKQFKGKKKQAVKAVKKIMSDWQESNQTILRFLIGEIKRVKKENKKAISQMKKGSAAEEKEIEGAIKKLEDAVKGAKKTIKEDDKTEKIFKKKDKDKDGAVTLDEFTTQAEKIFEKKDKDEDGALTLDEFTTQV